MSGEIVRRDRTIVIIRAGVPRQLKEALRFCGAAIASHTRGAEGDDRIIGIDGHCLVR